MNTTLTKNRVAQVAAALATVALLTAGCGNGSEDADQPTITDPADVGKGVALTYDSRHPADPEQVDITQGQVVFIAVKSDVTGTVKVDGYDVSQRVKADRPTTLELSANETGTFEVSLSAADVDAHLADLEITP